MMTRPYPASTVNPFHSSVRALANALLAAMAAFLVSATAVAQGGPTAAEDTRGAIEFIEGLSRDTIEIWSDQLITGDERKAAFRAILTEATDINLLSQVMLGRQIRAARAERPDTYRTALREYILTEFTSRMSQIGFKEVRVIGTTPASGRNGHVYVKTEIERDEGGPLFVDWRVRKKNGKFQVVNLEVEGINLVITTREYFASRIKELGGAGALIDELMADYVNVAETSGD